MFYSSDDKDLKHLTKRLSASGVSELFDSVKKRTCAPQADDINRYRLGIDGVEETLSVLHLEGQKHLSQSWSFVVQFTAPHGLSMSQVLSKRVVIALMTGRESGLVNATLGTLSNTLGKVGGRVLSSVAKRMTSDLSGFNARLGTEFGEEHQLYGVAMAFSQLSSSVDEARYEIAVYPRLQLLENTRGCAIYQNQTVPQIVEAVLRKHGLTGIDFRFELSESYPVKEYVTQWEESDLTFIRRLLADSGIWFWFESHSKNGCDVVVFGDSAQQYQDGPRAEYRTPSGHIDDGQEAVWDMSVTRRTVPNRVITQDYNYRTAQTRMKSEANERKKDTTTHGRRYLYAEHYRECGESVLSDSEQSDSMEPFGRDLDDCTTAAQEKELLPTGFSGSGSSLGSMTGRVTDSLDSAIDTITGSVSSAGRDIQHRANRVQSIVYQGMDLMTEASFSGEQRGEEEQEPEEVGQGAWYAKLRHQRLMTEQVTIAGKTTLMHLAPGQILTVSGSSIAEAKRGILIVSVSSVGDRSLAYQLTFIGIPYDVMCPYRPELLPWPSISGTLPARVTSPDSDQYGYMDSDGRYRVKMDFDLNDKWRRGEESLWMRRASVYAGDTYGLHFPLIDGTEVAIAFTGGNPDRPYISHAMHDSRHPEPVTAANHKRNVIRTPANNKLRMDDERGKEHIKIATEYGKTQLNMGHLVNGKREKRGEGFELRTDEWGAIRAGKGLFIGAHAQEKAKGNALSIDAALEQLSAANHQMRSLSEAASAALALAADVQAQQSLLAERIDALKSAVVLLSAPKGIALTSGEHLHASAGKNLALTAGKDVDISAIRRLTMAAGEAFSLFVKKAGIRLFAAKGKVEIQAQGDGLDLIARKGLSIISTEDEIIINAKKKITLNANGTYISLDKCLIELATLGDFKIKSASFDTSGPAARPPTFPNVPNVDGCSEFFTLSDQKTNQPLANFPYTLSWSGQDISGHTDERGNTQAIYTASSEPISVQPHPERVDRLLVEAAYWDSDTPLSLDFNRTGEAKEMQEEQAK